MYHRLDDTPGTLSLVLQSDSYSTSSNIQRYDTSPRSLYRIEVHQLGVEDGANEGQVEREGKNNEINS